MDEQTTHEPEVINDVQETADPGPDPRQIARENRELRERLARLEGRLEATAPGKPAPEMPEFSSDQEEYNYKMLQHAQALEAKLRAIEAKEQEREAAAARTKQIAKATKGLGLGKQSEFAKEHLELYLRLHPQADPDDVRDYARSLAQRLGATQAQEYVATKQADQAATRRPSQVSAPLPATAGGKPLSAAERLQATRDAALARLRAADQK